MEVSSRSSFCWDVFRRGLIYLEVPIEDDDHVTVQTLEGFVMNRVQGDYLEKLLYKILVSIDERTSVGEVRCSSLPQVLFIGIDNRMLLILQLATLLQLNPRLVRNAVSLSCRLNLAKKKLHIENFHPSWYEIMNHSSESSSNSGTKR